MILALLPGFLLTLLAGLAAFGVSRWHHSLDALVVALLIGMALRAAFGRSRAFALVVAYAKDLINWLIPVGVLLYALSVGVGKTFGLPPAHYGVALVFLAVALASGLLLSRWAGLKTKTGWLVAMGSAICGASAVAVGTTAIHADEEDTSNALVAVTVSGLIAVLALKALPAAFFTEENFAVFAGATLQQTGLVKMATAHLVDLQKSVALPVKLVRTALIPVVALGFLMYNARREAADGRRFIVVLLLSFIGILGLTGFVPALAFLPKLKALGMAATIVFSVAIVNLGLLVDLRTLKLKPIVVALAAWAAGSLAALPFVR